MIFDPRVGVGHVAIEEVLAIVVVGLQIGLLNLVADKLGVSRRQLLFDELDVAGLVLLGHLLALDRLLEHVHQMHGISAQFVTVEVVGFRQDLVGKARRGPVHAFGHAGGVLVFLHGASLWIGVLEAFPVVDAHFGVERGILVLLEARQDGELRQHLEREGRAGRARQVAGSDQFIVDLALLGDPQAVRHLDDADPVEESLVRTVGAEALPFTFVGVGDDDALIGHGADVLCADIGAILGRRQQRMQHLQRRLEHFDEFEEPLRRAIETSRVGVGVSVVLAVMLQFADIDLSHEGGDVLIVLIAGLRLGDADLAQLGRVELDYGELGDIAAEFVQALDRPWRDEAGELGGRYGILFLEHLPHGLGIEKAQRTFEDRARLVTGAQDVDGKLLHQILEAFGQRRLAAADGAEEVEDLFALFEALRGVAEIADDALDRFLEAEEIMESRINLDGPVHEDAAEALIVSRVHQLRLADRCEHAF